MRARRHSSWRDDGKKSEVWFQRSLSNIIQIGQHDLSLDVKGVGFIASVVRSIVTSFQVKRRIKRTVTNEGKTCIIRKIHQKQKYIFLSTNVFIIEECLPRASPPGVYNFKIFGSFFLLLILAIFNAWLLKRMCRYICSVFFPKVRKKKKNLQIDDLKLKN